MINEAQNLSREMILPAYNAAPKRFAGCKAQILCVSKTLPIRHPAVLAAAGEVRKITYEIISEICETKPISQ